MAAAAERRPITPMHLISPIAFLVLGCLLAFGSKHSITNWAGYITIALAVAWLVLTIGGLIKGRHLLAIILVILACSTLVVASPKAEARPAVPAVAQIEPETLCMLAVGAFGIGLVGSFIFPPAGALATAFVWATTIVSGFGMAFDCVISMWANEAPEAGCYGYYGYDWQLAQGYFDCGFSWGGDGGGGGGYGAAW